MSTSCSFATKISTLPTIVARRLMGTANLLFSDDSSEVSIAGIKIPHGEIPLSEFERTQILSGKFMEFPRIALEKTISSEDCVINVNCQFGYLSMVALQLLDSPSQLYSYELDKKYETALTSLFEANGFQPYFSMKALGDESRVEKIQFYRNLWEHNLLSSEIASAEFTEDVQIYSLKDELAALPRNPNYIICSLSNVNKSLFFTDCIHGFGKLLLLPDTFRGERVGTERLSTEDLNSILLELTSKGWNLKVWPGAVYYLSRERTHGTKSEQ